MMRLARASKPDGYLLGSYRIATAPEQLADTLTKPCLVLMVHQLALADRVRRPFSF
jgi:hypothetical protein